MPTYHLAYWLGRGNAGAAYSDALAMAINLPRSVRAYFWRGYQGKAFA